MSQFVEALSAVMGVRKHEHLFYSALQFEARNKLLVSTVKDLMMENDVVGGETAWSGSTAGFRVQVSGLQYVGTLSIYQSDLLLNHLQHISFAEFANHLGGDGIPAGETLGLLDLGIIWVVASTHHGFTNVINDVPQVSVDEIVYGNDLRENRQMQMVQPELKSVAC